MLKHGLQRSTLATLLVLLAAPLTAQAEVLWPADIHDAPGASCQDLALGLPADGSTLDETASSGLALPVMLDGWTAETIEGAVTVRVEDTTDDAVVAGTVRVNVLPDLLVWKADTPLTAGSTYRVVVTVNHDALPGYCGMTSGVAEYMYEVSVLATDPLLTAPEVAFEDGVESHTLNCSTSAEVSSSWELATVKARLTAGEEMAPGRVYRFVSTWDGGGANRDETTVPAVRGEALELDFPLFSSAVDVCVTAGVYDAITDTRVEGEEHCHSVEDRRPAADFCPETPPRSGSDEDDDCGCTSVMASEGSPLARFAVLLLALVGLGYRRKRR